MMLVPQVQWGVRVDEFHELSTAAPYVHPAAALKLQHMWDAGDRLLSLLDDRRAFRSTPCRVVDTSAMSGAGGRNLRDADEAACTLVEYVSDDCEVRWSRSWEQLADLNAQQSVAVIDETAAALATIPGGAVLDTVNQVFMVRLQLQA